MKNKIRIYVLVIMLILCVVLFAGCEHKMGNRITSGRDIQTFTNCVIRIGNDIVEGPITQWRDYEDSDTVQVLVNGKYYLTHYTNIVLIADPERGALYYGDSEWAGINE